MRVTFISFSIWIFNHIFTCFLLQIYRVYHSDYIPVISRISSILQLFRLFKLEKNSIMATKNCWPNVVLEVLPKGKGNCIYPQIATPVYKSHLKLLINSRGNNNQWGAIRNGIAVVMKPFKKKNCNSFIKLAYNKMNKMPQFAIQSNE